MPHVSVDPQQVRIIAAALLEPSGELRAAALRLLGHVTLRDVGGIRATRNVFSTHLGRAPPLELQASSQASSQSSSQAGPAAATGGLEDAKVAELE